MALAFFSSGRWYAALLGGPGLRLAWFWGFIEATLFFIVPDVLFTLTTLFSPRRGLAQLGLAVAGATVAGALMFGWAARAPAVARPTVAAVPFVGEKVILPAERRWNEAGTRALFENPLSGVPYKVYAVLAPAHVSLAEFLVVSVPMRAERMLVTWILFALLAWWLRHGDEHRRRLIAVRAHAVFWTVVYAVYWGLNRA